MQYAASSTLHILGYEEDDLLGKSFLAYVHPHDFAGVSRQMKKDGWAAVLFVVMHFVRA